MLIKSIKPRGNSQCIPITKEILDLVGLKVEDKIIMEIKKGKIVISPIKKENSKKE